MRRFLSEIDFVNRTKTCTHSHRIVCDCLHIQIQIQYLIQPLGSCSIYIHEQQAVRHAADKLSEYTFCYAFNLVLDIFIFCY